MWVAGEATVDSTGAVVSVPHGVEVAAVVDVVDAGPASDPQAASASASVTTMTLPVLVIMPPFLLEVSFIGRSCVPSALVEHDRLDDRCGLGDDLLEAVRGRHDRDRQRLLGHTLREVDEVET